MASTTPSFRRAAVSVLLKIKPLALLLGVCLLASCKPESYQVNVLSPALGSSVTALPAISGTYTDIKSPIVKIDLQLVRYSDGKMWDGTQWGGFNSTLLPTSINFEGTDWTSTGPMPAGVDLGNDFYNVVALGEYEDGEKSRNDSIFSVGTVVPPVTPSLYSWGESSSGQLGVGTVPDADSAIPVNMRGVLEGRIIVTIATGSSHVLALDADGKVYAWGYGGDGALGTGGTDNATTPVAISTVAGSLLAGKKITAIAAGSDHSLAVDDTGKVYAWGRNHEGELGNNNPGTHSPLPVLVGGVLTGKKVLAVTAGYKFSVALTDDGKVYSWGLNSYHQLGNGAPPTNSAVPVAVSGLGTNVITAIRSGPGNFHTLALSETGQLFAWGDNRDGKLGNGNATAVNTGAIAVAGALAGKKVTSIACGASHSLVVADGKVYAWGSAAQGQLGLGGNWEASWNGTPADPDVMTPTLVGGALATKAVTAVYAGGITSYAVTADNKLYSWGTNEVGELARPHETAVPGDRVPLEANVTAALSGGRGVLAMDAGQRFATVLTGFKPLPQPEMIVETLIDDEVTRLTNGGEIDFGTDAVGGGGPIRINIRNEGTTDLTDVAITFSGPDQYNFNAYIFDTTVAPGETMSFDLYFFSFVAGTANATAHITSSDPQQPSFDIQLTGSAFEGGVKDSTFATPTFDNSVRATAVQLDGKVLVGGDFTSIGGTTRNRIARLNADGTLDTAFNIDVNEVVNCIAIQRDGKILIGGAFNLVGGVARNRIARLNADGTLDTGFNPDAGTGDVRAICLRHDGRILIGGSFSSVGGTARSRLAQLNLDGSVDTAFAPVISSGTVECVAVHLSGVLLGGSFTSVNGSTHLRLARVLGEDGSDDPTFNAQVNDGTVLCMAIQEDDGILLGGTFSSVNSQSRSRLARVTFEGEMDPSFRTFSPVITGSEVRSIAVQANGMFYIGGTFSQVNGQTRSNVARLQGYDGQHDFSQIPSANDTVHSLALQKDGRLIMGGAFTATKYGQPAPRLVRLLNNNVFEKVELITESTVRWELSGAAPDLKQITLESSADGGATWQYQVSADATGGGEHTFVSVDLPSPGMVRVRGHASGGQGGGSSTLVESVLTYGGMPEIVVTSTGGMPHTPYGTTRDFGVAATGSGVSTVAFTLQNIGAGALRGLNGATISGPASASFRIVQVPSSNVAAGGSTSLVVAFTPRAAGPVPTSPVTKLTIPSNDVDENMYEIALTGIGGVDTANWKIQNNQVGVSDTADTDGDGIPTLLENALGSNPNAQGGTGILFTGPGGSSGGGGGGAPPPPPNLTFTYTRNKLALGDLVFQVEWSDTLQPNDWHSTDVTETILSDNGLQQQVQATIPAGTGKARFARLKVTRP